MPNPRRVEKVVCYVVRGDRLLVFRHVDFPWEEVGIQVPAGTIDPGEPPEAAAVREASEETGLAGVRIVRKLGETDYDVRPDRDEIHHRHVYQLTVDADTPERWDSVEQTPADGGPSVRFECFWIPIAHGHVLQSGQGALLSRIPD